MSVIKRGDYVLYRDPARFFKNQPNHTMVCEVVISHGADANVRDMNGARFNVNADYLRVISPEDVMSDIDALLKGLRQESNLRLEQSRDAQGLTARAQLTGFHAPAVPRKALTSITA